MNTLVVVMTVAAVLVAACGGGDSAAPTIVPAANTPVSAATPAPATAPSATATGIAAPVPDETPSSAPGATSTAHAATPSPPLQASTPPVTATAPPATATNVMAAPTDTVTPPAAPASTPHPGIGISPPDEEVNATLVLLPGGPVLRASDEVSYPSGDIVDRILYVVEPGPDPGQPVALRIELSCRFFGDRQFILRVDGVSHSRACGTVFEVPLQPQNAGQSLAGTIALSAPGLGPARVEWALALSAVFSD